VVEAPKPLNPIEAAAVEALLASMRAYRAQSPTSSYRTEYVLVINNLVRCSHKVQVEVPIRE
jgi:hypothetical protein